MKHSALILLVISALLCSSCNKISTQPSLEKLQNIASKTSFKPYKGNPVVTMGEKSTWDAGALGSMTVLKVEETFHMYYESWGVRSEADWDAAEYESLQIGHATSKDGIHWIKDSANPVLPKGAEGQWDRTGTWDPFVIYEDGIFKMWYGGGGGTKPCDWAYAESKDGSHFEKKDRISDLGGVEDCHVVHDTDAGQYLMYYWDREYEPMGLFLATSKNETFYADFERPHCPDSLTRYATSTDGINWTSRNNKLLEGHDAEVLKLSDDLYLMYYGPRNHFDAKDCDIRLAVYNGKLKDLIEQ
jgi:hypothetical protein